ncbi:uncharacterized protein A1O9_09967 [Exophiala aquamarina CBS 119918]|uniref:UspA domain-containing protein n=1 Tax=Exophiala aquamarina CBS 119918 TaxID=1182545 RepID=A0A072P392_9EURO|nr:uncharacterized protein A1O9_09967 [Exophiala aquamarina CBS 119918]KEF54172.1 hypothetical protein A1O9_09967 [Exophiala aquamarina CBS 119918]
MARPSSKARAPMSLEALLDEENREVIAALDRKRPTSPMPKVGTSARTATPPPVRSMLDVDSPTRAPRHGSSVGLDGGLASPPAGARRKSVQLDPSDPSTYTSPHTSKPNSPVLTKSIPLATRHRNSSEHERPTGLPKVEDDDKRGFEQNYQFDMASIPSSAGATPRSQADTKRPREGSSSAMAAAMSGDLAALNLPPSSIPNHNSSARLSHSRSPVSKTRKPEPSKSGTLLIPSASIRPLTTQSGTIVDDQAHRRLSNKSSSFSTVATDDSEEVQGRMSVDTNGQEEALIESSDDDVMSPSSDEDDTRGRSGRRKTSDTGQVEDPKSPDSAETTSPETERRQSATTQSVKSLLEPSISITSPTGESLTEGKSEVRPDNNFVSPSSVTTSVEDEDEDEGQAAIRKAKSLGLNVSPLDSRVHDRHVRIVLRGDWLHFNQQSEAGHRTARLYLVCSDLSVEAMYAMEWVVGTMLRDGDTLLAIYAIEDENAGKTSEADREMLQAEGTQAGKEASEVMATLTRQTTQGGGTSIGLDSKNRYIPATEAESLTGSMDARKTSKRELERLRAIEEITQNFIKLVRKTTLQVRCMIEVIHCKSPKHLILGAIDELEPTLCVVGTRGRSSLKGVLLGSFSNYLVTKSSVPVMVARRRLKKPRSQVKVSSNKIRLSNNLTASNLPVKRRGLEQARID